MTTLHTIKDMGNFKCKTVALNHLCSEVNKEPSRVYELISEYGGEADSVTREEIFSYIADKYHCGDYSVVYNAWLEEPEEPMLNNIHIVRIK